MTSIFINNSTLYGTMNSYKYFLAFWSNWSCLKQTIEKNNFIYDYLLKTLLSETDSSEQ